MRFLAAIVSFVIAFAMIAYGIAQRTVLAEPDNVTAHALIHSKATVTLIDSATLQSMPGRQNIQIAGSGNVFAAYGRTADVMAWVGNATYNRIGYSKTKAQLTDKVVTGKVTKVPNPLGSDLWLDEYSHSKSLSFTVNVPAGITVIIVSDGTKPAPANVAIRWPLDNRTPWAGPLIVGGILLLLVGAGLYIWALRHLRRSRGPRRKTPKMPKVPKQRSYKQPKPGKQVATTGRRSARRMVAATGMFVAVAVILTGCSPDLWPDFLGGSKGATPLPVASSAAPGGEDLQAPAVTAPQLKEIIAKISAVTTKADSTKDATLAATRFEGAALALRAANYKIRNADPTYAALPAIPATNVALILPQQSNTWPRTVFTVVQNPDDATIPPVALMLVQDTPRDNYKVDYAVALEAKAKLPDVAPANIGTARLPADTKLPLIAPSKLALAYGDIIEKGEKASTYSKDFDLTKDNLIGLIGLDQRTAQQTALGSLATISFANSNGKGQVIALGTNDSGAIVAVELNETATVTPTQPGAAVNPEGAVKSLSGITGSTKGTAAVYGDQLLFYVPKASSTSKIILLGFATGLISASELP